MPAKRKSPAKPKKFNASTATMSELWEKAEELRQKLEDCKEELHEELEYIIGEMQTRIDSIEYDF